MYEKYYIRQNRIVVILFVLLTCFFSNELSACQYNVRETGFADFGINQYSFYGFVNSKIPDDIFLNFEKACSSSFKNSNIVHEIINIDLQKNHLALKYISSKNIHTFPSAILVSPDSQEYVIPFPNSKQWSINDFESVLDRIVNSSVKQKIIDHVIKSYGVVLVVEGSTNAENERVRKSGEQAIRTIQAQMKFMPKSIEHPPELVILNRANFQPEQLLLWSLGLDSKEINDTYAAIIYGKARWIGPLLRGEDINKINLTNILKIIGMDCECGLDMQVLQGTKLPVRWDEKTSTRLVKHLGFDPENPVIKLEMNRILRKGLAHSPGVPLSYQSPRTNTNNQDDPLYVVDDQSYLRKPLYIMGFLSLLIIMSGLLIILQKRRKKPH